MSQDISDSQSKSDSITASAGPSNPSTNSAMNQQEVSDVDIFSNNEMESETSGSVSDSDTYIPPSTTTVHNHLGDQVHADSKKETSLPKRSQENTKESGNGDADEDARFVCNICLDPVKDAVVTVCGHLYCWPCLFRWLNIGHTSCPVCKAGVTKENVIPLYLQGNNEDPRVKHSAAENSVPNRPSAQRPTAQPSMHSRQGGMQFTGPGGGGMAFSAGLGFFPSLFGLQFQNFAPPPPAPAGARGRALTPEEIQQNFVSQALLMLGIFVLFCLLLI